MDEAWRVRCMAPDGRPCCIAAVLCDRFSDASLPVCTGDQITCPQFNTNRSWLKPYVTEVMATAPGSGCPAGPQHRLGWATAPAWPALGSRCAAAAAAHFRHCSCCAAAAAAAGSRYRTCSCSSSCRGCSPDGCGCRRLQSSCFCSYHGCGCDGASQRPCSSCCASHRCCL